MANSTVTHEHRYIFGGVVAAADGMHQDRVYVCHDCDHEKVIGWRQFRALPSERNGVRIRPSDVGRSRR